MKSQDILLLLKLVSVSQRDRIGDSYLNSLWQDWSTEIDSFDTDSSLDRFHLKALATHEHSSAAQYSVRALAEMTGISKSQVGLSLARCCQTGLAYIDRDTNVPRVNIGALGEFIVYGLRYVFPVELGALTRGIATAWAAPVLSGMLLSGGETPFVWPDPRGNTKGQSLEPIYKTVPAAVRKDPLLYNFLALTDSIRTGQARERIAASELLIKSLSRTNV